MVRTSETMVIIVLVFIIFLSQYQVFGFEGTSMCVDNTAMMCDVSPGDIIITRSITKAEVGFDGDQILCTTDEICHKLESRKEDQFCTGGINPLALHKCYSWDELEALVVWVLPQSFYRAVAFLIIGICIAKLFK